MNLPSQVSENFLSLERKDSSHSWRLWTRSGTTMEGTPKCGAASGWRRWKVCDPSITQTSCGVFECRGNYREDGDAWIWQILLCMTQSPGPHIPKHTKISNLLVSVFLILWSCKIFFSTNDRTQQREVETAMGWKLWNHQSIPLRGAETLSHWHLLWHKVS